LLPDPLGALDTSPDTVVFQNMMSMGWIAQGTK
jgi:hypothetical protein